MSDQKKGLPRAEGQASAKLSDRARNDSLDVSAHAANVNPPAPERHTEHEEAERCYTEALKWRERGFNVVPKHAVKKRPAVHWKDLQDRHATPDELASWRKKFAGGVGYITGEIENGQGYVVIDTDGWRGEEVLRQFELKTGVKLPQTLMVRSGSRRGFHRHYRHPGRLVPTRANSAIKLDVKGDKGFCVLPPSIHQSGKRYEIVVDAEPAPLPEGLLEFIEELAARPEQELDGFFTDIFVRRREAYLAPDALQKLFSQMAWPANVNETQLKAVQELHRLGFDEDEAVDMILDATRRVAPEHWDWIKEERKVRDIWQDWSGKVAARGVRSRENEGVSLDDFRAYMPMHNYIFTPTREPWPASSVNARLGKVTLRNADGKPILGDDSKPTKIPANVWLDQNQPVEQMTWAPGEPMLIHDRLISDGGWIDRAGMTCLNLYRPPAIARGDASKAGPWIEHVRRVYPDDADHIIDYLAHRVQKPQEKINHALLLGGNQGIGKDTMLEPVKHAIGPWNFAEVSPKQVLGRFNGFLKSVILRVSEVRDLGDYDRFQFYEHMKACTASPPDVLRVDEKHLREYPVLNCCAVIYTTNRTDSFYLPSDDRRTYVAWSNLNKEDFTGEYWNGLWNWYENGGFEHVAAYLAERDLTSFNAKAPPPKTPTFWQIVQLNSAPEESELSDILDRLGNPDAVTIRQIADAASNYETLYQFLTSDKSRRAIPHRMEEAGYVSLKNPDEKKGLWLVGGRRQMIYAKKGLTYQDQLKAARRLKEGQG